MRKLFCLVILAFSTVGFAGAVSADDECTGCKRPHVEHA